MKRVIIFALACIFVIQTKGEVIKHRDNGFLWHYKYINEREEEDGNYHVYCKEPGWDACRPAGLSIAVSDKMAEAEADIADAMNMGVSSGTFDYPTIQYYVEWQSYPDNSVDEIWYTYAEAIAAGLM